jgi:3-dehydroquinate dehydratase
MSSRKTYDTDIITLRRIFAVTPGTNAPIPSGNILATTSHGEAAYVNPYSIPGISQLSTALVSLPSTISTSVAEIGGVSQLLAGSGISLSPTNGIGVITITATGGGGSVTTANLTSTVIGLGSAGYISSAIGVAAIPGGLVSTANLAFLVSTANLARLVSTANLAGHISTANLAGHISTANLANLVSSSYLATQLGSTVIGLGTAGYFSTIPRSIQTQSISTGTIFTSSVTFIDTTIGFGYTGFLNQLIVSSGTLLLNNNSLSGGGGGGGAVSQIVGGTNITISPPGGTGVVTINSASLPSLEDLISTANLAGFVSTANLANFVSTSYLASQLTSTVIGLGTAGYISSVANVSIGGVVSTANLTNLVSTANLANLVSTSYFATQLASTVIGLGTAGYISSIANVSIGGVVSTANLGNLVSTANLANLVSTSYLATQLGSTVIGLGTAGYFSTMPGLLQTRSISTGTIFTSSVMLIDTTIGFGYTGFPNQLIVSSGTLLLNNNSLSGGGGGSGAVTQIVGGTNITISPPGGTGVVTINGASLPSLGGLVSTANLANLVSTANLANLVSTSYLATQLASTVIGLGTAGYISSVANVSIGGVVSTANLVNLVSTANLTNLVSTANLVGLVSTSYLDTQLASTINGLGTAGYLSTGFSNLIASSFTSSNATLQIITTSSILFGTGTGYLTLPNTVISNLSVGSFYVSSVGINCNSPAYTLDVNGDINADIGYFLNGAVFTSDRRIKTNITSADTLLCYSTVRELPLHRFEYMSSFRQSKHDIKQIGFIADEVETVFPKSIYTAPVNTDGFSTLNFVNFEQIQMAHFGATQYMASLLEQQNSTIVGQNASIGSLQTDILNLSTTLGLFMTR